MVDRCPRVSIGLPVHNGDRCVREAIDSILAQTFSDFELIISDNASSDRTEDICRAYAARDGRIRYDRNEVNVGVARNYNRVFERSAGAYFKWMAHDDILAPEYLARCVETMDRAPADVVLCFPRRRLMTWDGDLIHRDNTPHYVKATADPLKDYHRISFGRLIRTGWCGAPIFAFGLVRSSALRKTRLIGNYDATDVVLNAELRLLGEFWQVPEELFFQRLHAPTPDIHARLTPSGLDAWLDPDNGPRKAHPEIRVFLELVAAIRRSERSVPGKAMCYAAMPAYAVVRTYVALARLPHRCKRLLWKSWTAFSVRAARTPGTMSLALRCWALLAGTRRRDRRMIASALSRPWFGANATLLEFAARRFVERREPPGLQLLDDWLTDPSVGRRIAAATAMAPHRERFERAIHGALRKESSIPKLQSLRRALQEQHRHDAVRCLADTLDDAYADKPDPALTVTRS